MLPTIIEKTQPISGATASSPSNPGLVPYIPAGADGYLHTSGEFKPIVGTGENKYFSPQLDYDNTIVIEKRDADLPDPPATEAEELRFNEFVAPSNGQLIPYGASSTTTGLWLGYWGYIVPADGSPELKINFSGPRLPQYTDNIIFQLHYGPYTLSKGDKFYMACNGAVAKLIHTIYTFIPFKYQDVSETTTLDAYYSTELNWEQSEVVRSINATESSTNNDVTIATYTATANGEAFVYVQSSGFADIKTWAGFRISVTTASGKIIKLPSTAILKVSGTALLQTVLMNKGDTISVEIPALYTNVEVGSIRFVPFKYQKTNVIHRDRVVRKLGEIFIYAGTDIPDNSLPLDGQIITECDIQYPDLYTWIINNAKTITLTEYETKISQYGQCGHFGLDTTTKTVRLPKIKAFIQNAESVSEIAEVENAGLPNITGSWIVGWKEAYIPTILTNGAIYTNSFEAIERIGDKTNTNVNNPYRVNFDASRSNIIYGNSTTVTPDNVKYRYFICTKNEFKETFNSQLIEGRRELDRTNKITISIPQTTTPTAGNTATFLDYTAPDNGIIIIHTIQSESTGYNLTGFDTKIIPYDDPNNTLNIGFTGIYSTPGETNKSGSNIEKYYELNKGDIIQCILQSNYNSINAGGAYFIPYKYKELPYTQYTQGELTGSIGIVDVNNVANIAPSADTEHGFYVEDKNKFVMGGFDFLQRKSHNNDKLVQMFSKNSQGNYHVISVATAEDGTGQATITCPTYIAGAVTNLSGTYVSSATERYRNSALEIRENNYVSNTQTDIGYAPSIGFHWGNTTNGTLVLKSDGAFAFINGSGARATVNANVPYSSESGTSTKWNGAAKTVSTAAPSGGANGDIWFQY